MDRTREYSLFDIFLLFKNLKIITRKGDKKVKTVFLTSGTRGAGKSTYCSKIIKNNSEISLISRDEILIELFGQTELDSYGDGHYYAYEIMWERVNKQLKSVGVNGKDFQMILDCWNGFPEERQRIIRKLREAGADRVVIWVFTTPLETIIRWFDEKNRNKDEDREFERKINKSRSRHDYELFNELAANIKKDGFDEVVYINPLL